MAGGERRRAEPARRLGQPPPPAPPSSRWSSIRAAIPVLISVGVVGWLLHDRHTGGAAPSPLADIADLSPPRVSLSESLPRLAESGAMELARGDCRSAAAHFRTAHSEHPELPRLAVLEGASFVCAGDGPAALKPLRALSAQAEPPPLTWWYLAQACLLIGDGDCAARALSAVIEQDRHHLDAALTQQSALQALLSAP